MISPSGTNYSETSNLEDLKTKPGKVGGPAHTNDEVRILSCLIRRQYSIFMKKYSSPRVYLDILNWNLAFKDFSTIYTMMSLEFN
jgi:hypothetical protein